MLLPFAELCLLVALVVGRKNTPECQYGRDEAWLEWDPAEEDGVCSEDDPCGGNEKNYCVNGSCVCFLTYGYALNEVTGKCDQQIDECHCEIAACEQICTDFTPTTENDFKTYECSCEPGYELYNIHFCQDIDECATEGFCGPDSSCENSVGGFECTCGTGWELDSDTGMCVDISECSDGANGGCEQNCMELDGSFLCTCEAGFVLSNDGKNCDDIDECLDEVTACGDNMNECVNDEGSYTCTCLTGYTSGSIPVCEDIDECETVVCGHGGECINSDGSFSCACGDGFQNGADGLCHDIDECQAEEGEATICGDPIAVSACQNSVGSWSCTCVEGYEGGEGVPCTNIDECAVNPDICLFGTCFDQAGTFSCDCQDGYASSGFGAVCTQIDECASDNACGDNSVSCQDVAPGYQCTCASGYNAEFWNQCVDVDECEVENICGDSAIDCENLDGSYSCKCSSGFTGGDETECTDINECSIADFCQHDGVCTNSDGSFECTCNYPTYTGGVGQTCTDNDECTSHPDICGTEEAHLECENIDGGYECICAPGYQNDDETSACINIDECSENSLEENCGGNGVSCSDLPGSFQCTCTEGFEATSVGAACTDIDECEGFSCDEAGTCSNSEGSFSCTCFNGYQNTEAGSCADVDECQQADALCGEHLGCENSDGSYTCNCGATGQWPGPGSQCLYDRQLLVEIQVEEPWSVELMDKDSVSYNYLESQIPSQIETAVSSSESLSSNFVSAELTGLTQHKFMCYLTLDFTYLPTSMTDEEILQQIRDGYAANQADMVIDLDMTTLAIQGESSGDEGPQIELQCHEDSMEVVVDATSVEAGVQLSLMDPNCQFEQNEDGDYVISTEYTLCDTKKTSSDAVITYIQYVLVDATVQYMGPDGTAIVTHDHILAGLNCIYSTTSVTMTSLVVDEGPIVVEEAGSFSVELSLYTDETFTTKHTSFPVTIDYLDDIYVAARLDSPDSNLRLNLDACWLTNTPNVYNPIRLYIMQDYCPTDPDFTYVTELRTNTFVPFQYDAQLIISNGEINRDVYYICQYTLCDLSDESSACPDETNSCDAGRRRMKRSANEQSTSLYLGMVTLNVRYEEDAVPRQQVGDQSSNEESLVPVVAVSSVATLVLSLALFGMAFMLFRRFGKKYL